MNAFIELHNHFAKILNNESIYKKKKVVRKAGDKDKATDSAEGYSNDEERSIGQRDK